MRYIQIKKKLPDSKNTFHNSNRSKISTSQLNLSFNTFFFNQFVILFNFLGSTKDRNF